MLHSSPGSEGVACVPVALFLSIKPPLTPESRRKPQKAVVNPCKPLYTAVCRAWFCPVTIKFEEDFAVKLQFSSRYFGEGEEFLSPLRKFVTPGVSGYKADFGLTLVIFSRREVRLVLHSIGAGSPSSIMEHRRKESDCCFWDREKLRRGPVNFAVQRTDNRRHQGRGR
ncbi:hypothetical protein BSL78_09134 [Apostichopus japonicus]|uniref:Uncharacterized protein n=1 Tax=Stichopus japonicus TaxID=307972 RepID=A0A2G8L114_STIJA|nr:hypothetical protein BSL78_09134 [Apostichopus japonicus]